MGEGRCCLCDQMGLCHDLTYLAPLFGGWLGDVFFELVSLGFLCFRGGLSWFALRRREHIGESVREFEISGLLFVKLTFESLKRLFG